MRKPQITEMDYIDLQRFMDEEKRLRKLYRDRHRRDYYDSTEWPEAVDTLRALIYKQREGLIYDVELLEEV